MTRASFFSLLQGSHLNRSQLSPFCVARVDLNIVLFIVTSLLYHLFHKIQVKSILYIVQM
jgi:hypothetical protein